MDIFKDKRNHTQGGTEHLNKPTTGQERTQGIAPFLFVCTSEREKATPATKTKQERQDKRTSQGATKAKPQKQGKKIKRKAKRIKRKANTPQAIKPPNLSRTQKPHKPRKAPEQYKPTSSKGNPLKTPLKREIKPYLQATHRGQSERADERQGTRHERTTADLRQVLSLESLYKWAL